MLRRASILIAGHCLLYSCTPKSIPGGSPTSSTDEAEFERILVKSVTPPARGIHWVDWDLTSGDHRMLEMACTSPSRFDRLLDRVAEIPEPSFPGCFFWYSHDEMKDCPLGEDYTATLPDRLVKEERPNHRKVIRDAIRWHSFHEHAHKGSKRPYEESVASKILGFERRDEEDDRTYGIVQANYAPRFPEAAAEMWRVIRADAEKTDSSLIIGAFETSFNGLRKGPWAYRTRFLEECLRFLELARDLENPWAAGWMLKRQFVRFAGGTSLEPGEVFDWESALLVSAAHARSPIHRGDAILALLAIRNPRVIPLLGRWLQEDLPDSVIEDFLRELRIEPSGSRDLLSEFDHPRVRARLTVGREVRKLGYEN
jgi:hypothetical protein